MNKQTIDFRYNTEIITIEDSNSGKSFTKERSGNTVESIDADKMDLLNQLLLSQNDDSL